VAVPAGTLLAGVGDLEVPAFRLHRHEVTNGEYAAFLQLSMAQRPGASASYWMTSPR
jgi:formylglycine-generating enzyme required for sulfatase activity